MQASSKQFYAKAYSNSEFAALIETARLKITAIKTTYKFCNFPIIIKTAKNTVENVSWLPKEYYKFVEKYIH